MRHPYVEVELAQPPPGRENRSKNWSATELPNVFILTADEHSQYGVDPEWRIYPEEIPRSRLRSLKSFLERNGFRKSKKASPPRNGFLLTLASVLLPCSMRAEWLEEQRSYLYDLSGRRSRLTWVWRAALGMPRFAYTVRTGITKESA